jgi:hypothetical protein
MKIVSMGRDFPAKKVDNIMFSSEFTLLDYDLVLWDLSGLLLEYATGSGHYQGCISLSEYYSAKILEDMNRRKREIADLIKLGRTVIIFTPELTRFFIDTGQRTYSGTGKNRITTIQVSDYSLRSFVPISGDFNTLKAIGSQMDFRGEELFRTFWDTNKDKFCYRAYFTHKIGHPFLFVHGTDKIVGTWIRSERGNMLLIPHLLDEEYFKRAIDYKEASRIFIDSIIETVHSLQKEIGDFSLPKWTLGYRIPKEQALRVELKALQEGLKQTQSSIEAKRAEISNIEKLKLLICGKGNALRIQVIEVLRELGIDAKEGPESRDDITMTFEGIVALGEVKGTNKSAAESHAAQLEKWVSEYFSEHGIKAKGILFINAFCDTPLTLRTEEAFPKQMLKYCINREHCLITTSQLLGILLATQEIPEKRMEAVHSLFSTVGIFKGFEDFSSFLDASESEGEEDGEVVVTSEPSKKALSD